MTFGEAEELRRDYRHLECQLFQGKEVSEVLVGPADKNALFDMLAKREAGVKHHLVLDDSMEYEVYLLLDTDKYSRGTSAIALLRGVMDDLTGGD